MPYIFTKNYDNMMLGLMGYVSATASPASSLTEAMYLDEETIVCKRFNAGSSTSSSVYFSKPQFSPVDQAGYNNPYQFFNTYALTVGTGTGQVGYFDYQLESGSTVLFSGFNTSGSSQTYNNYDLKISQSVSTTSLVENGKHYIVVTFQLRNDGADTKNISEICFAPRCREGSQSISDGNRFLFYHEIFDSAVSVGPGDFFTYENKIEIPVFRPNKPSV